MAIKPTVAWPTNVSKAPIALSHLFTLSIMVLAPNSFSADPLIHLRVTSVSMTVDSEMPPIDFQTSSTKHHCGGEPSNHFRVYSSHEATRNHRFDLLLRALERGLPVSLRTRGCEGPRMLVDWIQLARP